MANEEQRLTIVELFNGFPIRKVWHQGEWWYSLVDAMTVFAGTNRARKYWYDLKKRIITEEGYGLLSEKIGQLKFEAPDGKFRLSDAANLPTFLRILQSVSSPKAEDFKQWLSALGTEEIQSIEDPEQALERLRRIYEQMGRSPTWIKFRLDGILIRKKLTSEWQVRGIVAGWEYAVLTNQISEETFGITTKEHKDLKGLSKQELREHYTDIEHALINLSEAAAHEFAVQRDSHGFERIQRDAIDGGKVGGRARADLESQGLQVVSSQNFLNTPQIKNKQLPATPDQPSLFDSLEEEKGE